MCARAVIWRSFSELFDVLPAATVTRPTGDPQSKWPDASAESVTYGMVRAILFGGKRRRSCHVARPHSATCQIILKNSATYRSKLHIWPHVRLSLPTTTIAYWTVLYGTYVNWLITILAAVFGTAALSPITGAGHSGQPWQEGFVTIGFMSVGITIVTSSVLVLWGLRRKVSP